VPYLVSTFQLPSGAQCIRADAVGNITVQDAEALMRPTHPGGPMAGLPMLILTARMEIFTPEARNLLTSMPDEQGRWIAVVAPSAVARVTGNFVLRVGNHRQVKMFVTEAEATVWLEEQIRAGA
jgi:hypothetical protein